ncbi:Glucose-induced degradation protein 4-like [Porphyridium purpureum]|uniref:Glucose-induced degradation protein 4-like n=1 Tax=Porphyridium purpureum TaxID=35688 RepID=A0A5J4YYM6_PORPP|nr:Glucose-induced degradation protein 4-like [Porphyridium purpureum]|eukprot:POR4513..scf208_2
MPGRGEVDAGTRHGDSGRQAKKMRGAEQQPCGPQVVQLNSFLCAGQLFAGTQNINKQGPLLSPRSASPAHFYSHIERHFQLAHFQSPRSVLAAAAARRADPRRLPRRLSPELLDDIRAPWSQRYPGGYPGSSEVIGHPRNWAPPPNPWRASRAGSRGTGTGTGTGNVARAILENANGAVAARADAGVSDEMFNDGDEVMTSSEWAVNVRILSTDYARGTLCGVMEAVNVPKTPSPVLTFWEGEIIDNRNAFFHTGRWDASREHDLQHWSKFDAFAPLRSRVMRDGGVNIDLSDSRHVFMRWKEEFFVNVGPDCGLTIDGFYYLCLDRETGFLEGYYHDPGSAPFQRLQLQASSTGRGGFAWGDFEFL